MLAHPSVLFADPIHTVAAVAGQIEMKMIAVECIVLWAENGSELLARPAVDRTQEGALAIIAVPARFN